MEEIQETKGSVFLRELLAVTHTPEAAKGEVHGIAASRLGHIQPTALNFIDVPQKAYVSLQAVNMSNSFKALSFKIL